MSTRKCEIAIIARDDWANAGWLFEQAFKAVGIDAYAVKEMAHDFQYEKEADVLSLVEIREIAQEAKGLLFMHSRKVRSVDWARPDQFSAVFHGGATYRRNPEGVNGVFNPYVDATLIHTADLLRLGAKNEHWVMPPVDTNVIGRKNAPRDKKLIIAHYPSKPDTKGSDVINRVMARLAADVELADEFEYQFSDETMPWRENLDRMAGCDIYVESMTTEFDGRRMGVWGMTALEAAAMGRIVVSIHETKARYEAEFGPCAIIPANTEAELDEVIRDLLTSSKNLLKQLRRDSRRWVEDNHSFKAVGNRLATIFETAIVGKCTNGDCQL